MKKQKVEQAIEKEIESLVLNGTNFWSGEKRIMLIMLYNYIIIINIIKIMFVALKNAYCKWTMPIINYRVWL